MVDLGWKCKLVCGRGLWRGCCLGVLEVMRGWSVLDHPSLRKWDFDPHYR